MPNEIIQREYAGEVLGVPGRFYNVVADTDKPALLRNQTWKSYARKIRYYGENAYFTVEIRFDDNCGNGHNSFAITGDITAANSRRRDDCLACGCLHDEIAKHFPELVPLIQWHLTSSDEPLHYVANAAYFAGDRDHNGLAKGEKRQIRNRNGLLAWRLAAIIQGEERDARIDGVPQYVDSATQPTASGPGLVYVPWYTMGEGKEREFDKARKAAIWPEATDEQLSLPRKELEAVLRARLPDLQRRFREAVESCGLLWDQSQAKQSV
jgi:hypothetical protein